MSKFSAWWAQLQRVDLRRVFLPVFSVFLAVLALNALFYFFLTRPRLELALGSKSVFESTDLAYQREQAALSEARNRLSQVRCVTTDLERFHDETLATKVGRMTRVQKYLRDLARTYRMDPESISYNFRELKEGGFLGFYISFPLRGTYEDLRQFLHHIEASEQFLLIEQIGLSGNRQGGSQLNLNIQMSTFFAGVESTPAADSSQDLASLR